MPRKPTESTKVGTPGEGQVRQAIFDALAEAQDKPVDDVCADLVAAGPQMPLDSLEMVEIMLALEEHFGIRFPDTPETCEAFQSVQTLTDYVCELGSRAQGDKGGS